MSIQIKTIMYNCRLGSITSKTASKGYEQDPLFSGIVSVLVASLGAGSFSLEARSSSSTKEAPDWKGFLNCTKIMVMLSHPSPPAVEGAKHLSRTLSHTAESLFSYKSNFLRQFVFWSVHKNILSLVFTLMEALANEKARSTIPTTVHPTPQQNHE